MDATTLSQLLLATMSPNPDEIKRAEAQLKQLKQSPGFAFNLLTLCHGNVSQQQSEKLALDVAKAAAICFKNFVNLNWDVALSQERGLTPDCQIQDQERAQIKAGIVDFMCKVHPNVQKQLGEAVRVIAQSDWPEQWPELIPALNAKLLDANTSFPVLLGCLSTLNELFKRFRDVQGNDYVYTQLKIALESSQEEITSLFSRLVAMLSTTTTPNPDEENILACLRLVLRIFYSLNWQTIPEFFEDNIAQWIGEGHAKLLLLPAANSALHQNQETPSMQERVQCAVLENVRLYAEKYSEEFAPYLQHFLQHTFGLLVTYSPSTMPRHSELLISGMRFVSVCINQPYNRTLFEDKNTLQAMLERIIIPNLTLSQVDLETFRDNPMEYLQRDMQGSDFETRRRVASEMIEKLCKQFDPNVSELCQQYISQLLANNAADWRAKDVAITLMIAISVERQTSKEGCTQVKNEQQMLNFLRQHLPLEQQQQSPIITADTIKYLAVFRQFVPKDYVVQAVLPYLVGKLEDKQVCIHTYAASALDGFLSFRAANKRLTREEVAPFVQPILVRLFNLIDAAEENYNEHVMRTVLRVINVSRLDVGPVVPGILTKLGAVLTRVANNPSNPTFNHLLFETISALIRFGFESQQCTIQQLEAVVNPAFERILQAFIVEFVPYVLQIMAQTLRMRPTTEPLPQQYAGIFPGLFSPALWQTRANVPALVIFLQAFMMRQPHMFDDAKCNELVSIACRLVAVKSTEEYGFDLAKCMVATLPQNLVQQDKVSKLFGAGFMRLSTKNGMTPMLIKQLVGLTSITVGKRGAAFTQQSCDVFGPGTFERFVVQMLAPNLTANNVVTAQSQKRVAVIGLTRLLVETSTAGSGAAFSTEEAWNSLAVAVCQVVLGHNAGNAAAVIVTSTSNENAVNESLEHMAEGTGTHQFARLSFSLEEAHDDYFKDVPDVAQYCVRMLVQQNLVNRILQVLAQRNLQQAAEQFRALCAAVAAQS